MNAEIGTPAGFSQSASIEGHWPADAEKREFGCAAFPSPVCGWPLQLVRLAGASLVTPSHHTSPLSVSATLVSITSLCMIAIQFGFVLVFVPGATPMTPPSGLIAYKRPSSSGLIQAISS